MNLIDFEKIFRSEIAPIYINNQEKFDNDCIHGCLHISRSLIISNLIYKKIKERELKLDIDKIYYAVAFHDSGRKSNGFDFWEKDSYNLCREYLISKNISDYEYISSIIIKDTKKENDYNYLVYYDTDVLEIIRPCSGIGLYNFNDKYLKLQNHLNYNIYKPEIFSFIIETENIKDKFVKSDSLFNLLIYLNNKKNIYPELYAASIA